jgi:DNA-binding MarR family transcriptional regulator
MMDEIREHDRSREGFSSVGNAPRQQILHSIRRITRALDLYSKKLVVAFGITTPQLLVLDEIIAKGAMTLRSIAEQVHLSSSTLVGIIDRLEAKGLAQRERDGVDRRKVMVMPTEAGRALIARAPSALQGTLAEALDRLPADEQLTIARSLERIVDLMEIGKWERDTLIEETPPIVELPAPTAEPPHGKDE